jgi:hypothetical protein
MPGYNAEHRDERNAYNRDWYVRNYTARRLAVNTQQLQKRTRDRIEAIQHYGGACACCDESEFRFLTLDHINGGGGAHRKELKGRRLASVLKQQNWPEDYQVLCWNCNCAKQFNGGICPHEEKRRQE